MKRVSPSAQYSAHKNFERVILVTGGGGFLGSNLCVHLVKKYPQYHIVVYDKLTYCGFKKNLEEVWHRRNFTFIKGDILSADLVNHVLGEHCVDTIIAMAAESHVDNSFGNSLKFTEVNTLGTHVLLECAKKFGSQIKMFWYFGTDECYSGKYDHPCTEDDTVLCPSNPYSASKTAAEHIVRAYNQSFKLPILITRLNNAYGPKQFPEKVIPKFISLMERDRPVPVHGSGMSRRSFLYVDDVVDACDVVLHKARINETYNIASEKEYTILETFTRLARLMGWSEERVQASIKFVRDRNFNDQRYFIDCSKMRELGWEPKVSFDEGLQKTIDWYRANPNHFGNIEDSLVAHPGEPAPARHCEAIEDEEEEKEESEEEKEDSDAQHFSQSAQRLPAPFPFLHRDDATST